MALKRNRSSWRDDLSRTSWQNFERVLADHYRDAGYEVEHCGTGFGTSRYDGGVDLVLRREGDTVLVQCKHWNAAQVPHNDVHQLLGLVETRGATRAVLVTSGEFTAAARDAASRSSRIELLDGADLRRVIHPRLIPVPMSPVPITSADLSAWAPVAETTVDAVVDVMSGRSPRARRRTLREELIAGAFRLVLGVIVALAVLFFVRQQLDKVFASVAPTPRPERVAPVPSGPPAAGRTPVPPRAASSPEPPDGMREMTDEELAEWTRRNRESMEILERTTPELKN